MALAWMAAGLVEKKNLDHGMFKTGETGNGFKVHRD